MPKRAPQKCINCSKLTADQAKQRHGPSGDNCWDSDLCPNRRSYLRHRARRNLLRNQKRWAEEGKTKATEVIAIDAPPVFFAILHLYRRYKNASIHAIGGQVWQGQGDAAKLVAEFSPIHCLGMNESGVKTYIKEMIRHLSSEYGLVAFQDELNLDPAQCPIEPCPLRHQPSESGESWNE